MAQRGNRPRRSNQSNSPIAIVAASVLLVVVAAIVGWLIFGYNGAGQSTPVSTASASVAGTSTATPTVQVGAATSTPEATATATESATPEATPTETEAATPEPTVAPTPTPLVGDYGELPSADIPSGTPGSRRLQLTYHLNMSLQDIPQQADVYLMQSREWTQADVENLAQSLGITGNVDDQGNGSFRVSGNGSLYISNNLVQYIAPTGGGQNGTPVANEPLPDNNTLVQTARGWLIEQDLLGATIGPGSVISRDENQNIAQVQIKPVEPGQLLSAIPSANVTLNGAGVVTEAYIRWPASMPRSTYGLRSAAELWDDAAKGVGYIEIDDSQLPSGSGALPGDATITSASLAYTTAGAPETKQYLVPLVVFEGQATISGADAPIPIKIYVPAAGAQTAPRG
ncbi:MAG: hypothetical protein WBW04_02500 [Nitrolancea sp.]